MDSGRRCLICVNFGRIDRIIGRQGWAGRVGTGGRVVAGKGIARVGSWAVGMRITGRC